MQPQLLVDVFFASLALGLCLDLAFPLRGPALSRWFRWTNNGLLYLLNSLITRLAVPGGLLALAYWVDERQLGALHHVSLPIWLEVMIGVLLMDLTTYGLHRASHRFAPLWRLHRLHHTDIDVDVTTDLRHHPLERILAVAVGALVIIMAGISPQGIFVFSLLAVPVSVLSHGNWLLPAVLDRWLRMFLVTPGMHRIHHSARQVETDSNYGVLFSVWDRMFNSYCKSPQHGYRGMTLGLEEFREKETQFLHRMLLNPID